MDRAKRDGLKNLKTKTRKTVLVHMGTWRFSRVRLAGIYRFAHEHGWIVRLVERIGANVRMSWMDALSYWRPDGVIVDGDDVRVPDSFGIPSVHCDADPRKMEGPYYGVMHDSIGAAELVMKELTGLHLPHYAFAGFYAKVDWSQKRLVKFRETLGSRFESGLVLADGSGNGIRHIRRMRGWLASLPRPCGIFAVNDGIARHLAQICRELGIVVPDEIAIGSVDNDEVLCEGEEPTLTSATQDFEESGYYAAEMLDSLMSGKRVKPRVRTLPKAMIIRRQSTRKFNAGNAKYVKAVEFIRLHACEGIGAKDVIAHLGCDASMAERRFRQLTGHSILQEILDVRLSKACELLRDAKRPLKTIHSECGYADYTAFRRFFKQRSGQTPGAYRKASTRKQ